jgi:catechol 2,3-dioxygenase-like lactoylglutathione lyase family enzyme
MLNSVTPCFIVDDLSKTIAFYSSMAFSVLYKGGDENGDFWAMLGRDQVAFMFKSITPDIHPQPNRSRHEWAPWDAYIFTPDPDSLYAEFLAHDVPMHQELADTHDGLRAFEVMDNSGYLLCFGRPIEK